MMLCPVNLPCFVIHLSYRGTLSTNLGKLSELVFFLISNNAFSGTIPLEFANLTRLQEIRLGTCRFFFWLFYDDGKRHFDVLAYPFELMILF